MVMEYAYWNIRGLAQPVRMLLNYVGAEFVDKRYQCQNEPPYDRSEWLNVKYSLGLDFPNLPYLIDGDVKLTQSNSILRYLGRKYNLEGDKPEIADMLSEQIMDFRNSAVYLFYSPAEVYASNLPRYIDTTLKNNLKIFSDFLGNKPFLLGNSITYPDFHLYEMLWQHHELSASSFNEFPTLIEYMKRFESEPKIAAYMKSDKFLTRPINNPMANFV